MAGTNGGSFSSGPVDAVDLPQRRKIQQPRHLDDVTGVHVELAQQQLQHVLGHVVGDLEPHRRAESPTGQFALERLQQVLVAVLFDLEVGVAGDAERVMLDDLQAGEQHRQEGRDQLLHRQEPQLTVSAVQFDEAVDVVGHLDSREVLTAVIGVLDGDGQVQAQAADERERMRRVDRQRRQYREHLLVEVGRQPVPFVVVELGPRDDDDALVGERRAAPNSRNTCACRTGDLLGAFADPAQLLAWGKAVGGAHRQPHLVAPLEAGHPHHVELVEVGREDGEELRPLQQRK